MSLAAYDLIQASPFVLSFPPQPPHLDLKKIFFYKSYEFDQ